MLAALGGQAQQKQLNYTEALRQKELEAMRGERQATEAERTRQFGVTGAENTRQFDARQKLAEQGAETLKSHYGLQDAEIKRLQDLDEAGIEWARVNSPEAPTKKPNQKPEEFDAERRSYWNDLAVAAQRAGRPIKEVQAYAALATGITTQGLAIGRTEEIRQGKIPLERALTAYRKAETALLPKKLAQALQIAKMREGGQFAAIAQRAQAAANSVRARYDIAKGNNEEREALAVGTQIGMLNRLGQSEAFQAAMQEQRLGQQRATEAWKAQTKAIGAGGAAPAGYDPSGPPTINLTMPSFAPSAGTTNITVQLSDGTKKTIAVPSAGGGGGGRPKPIDPKHVSELRATFTKHNVTTVTPEQRTATKSQGYTDEEIDAALKPQAAKRAAPVNRVPVPAQTPVPAFNLGGT